MKNFLLFCWELAKIALIALVIVIPIRYFLFQPFFVKGQSMEPNFENGDYLIVDEITYRFREPKRGEVIVSKNPKDSSQRVIKRVIGLPGEVIEIKNGRVAVYKDGVSQILNELSYLDSPLTLGEIKVQLKENEYFVLGDNRLLSLDSRKFGPLLREAIIGRVFLKAWPFASFREIKAPVY